MNFNDAKLAVIAQDTIIQQNIEIIDILHELLIQMEAMNKRMETILDGKD